MSEEGKGSVLKSAMGLENLKGLGDGLKQLKEAMGKVDELQKNLGELAKDNSPIGKALAQLIEAEGIKSLNEGNASALQEGRQKMAQEIEDKNKTIDELAARNKELEEDRVINEVGKVVTSELDRRLPSGKTNRQGDDEGSRIIKSLEGVVADYLDKRLAGSDGNTLGGDQIRAIIHEEVGKLGGGKSPEEMVESLVNALTVGDKLRERLGVAGLGGRLLQGNQGGDSGLRTDMVKLLLEDERERLKIQQNHQAETQRNKHLGTIADAVKDNLGDGVAALTAAAGELKAGTGTKSPATAPEQKQVFACGDCQVQFNPPAGWAGQPLKCPGCGREYSKEELSG